MTSMGTLTTLISTLTASTDTFMDSTTLTQPTLIRKSPCKHSHASATVLRPLVALSHALSLPLQALLWPFHALSRTLQTLSYEILPTFFLNIFSSYTVVQKHFLKAMRVLLEAERVLVSKLECL